MNMKEYKRKGVSFYNKWVIKKKRWVAEKKDDNVTKLWITCLIPWPLVFHRLPEGTTHPLNGSLVSADAVGDNAVMTLPGSHVCEALR